MFYAIYIIHILICLGIIALVLLQQGKGAEAGAIFGSNSDSVVGPGSAPSFFTKFTTGMAIAFMVTSVLLVKTYMNHSPVSTKPAEEISDPLVDEIATKNLLVEQEAEKAEATKEAEKSEEKVSEEKIENTAKKEKLPVEKK